jgi:hypothetical protein
MAAMLPPEVAAREPTEQEQYFVELINRARLDPAALATLAVLTRWRER